MPERKAWTPEQDQLLKHLRQQAKINKWSIIAKKMAEQYNMAGRTGKQCRERYHNHLDSKISRAEWTKQQEQNLYTLHDQIGNKWAIIAQKLAGRTDNCVKNHFYSRMRKAIRKLNKTIHQHNKKDYKEIKMQTLYKIVQATDEKFKNTINPDQQLSDRCCKIKNLLLNYSNDDNVQLDADIETLKQLYHNIHQFSLRYKCKQKRERRNSQQGDGLLQVPRFSHKGKTTSDRGSEEDQDEYSKAFSKSYDGEGDDDDEDMEQSYVSSRPKISSTPKIAQAKKQQAMIIPTPIIAPQPLKPPVLSIKVPTISSKFSLNMEQDPQKMESLLKHEGLLENSEMLHKNGQLGRGSTLRRDDSYGLMIDEENKLHNSLLGDSVRLTDHHHVNLSSNLNFSVDLEEDNKLFR